MLALGGYLSSEGRDISQPGSALTAIALGFSLVPAALTLLSLWWLRQYTLDPAEVAALAAFLMAEPAAYVTGAVLPVDGGLTAMMGVHR